MSGLTLFIIFAVNSGKTAIIEKTYPTPLQCVAELKNRKQSLGEQVILGDCY